MVSLRICLNCCLGKDEDLLDLPSAGFSSGTVLPVNYTSFLSLRQMKLGCFDSSVLQEADRQCPEHPHV